MKRTVLQMRRMMKIMGMSVSFTSAMEEKAWDGGLLAKMGRYSDRATCCARKNTQSDTGSYNSTIRIFSRFRKTENYINN